mmetsp:Transcript_43042/g.101094  ORF Transcript_43042/g.101094 Transcript_43042/m.101094 type:complete len:93 (+) Transcript_43042:33-311(+)
MMKVDCDPRFWTPRQVEAMRPEEAALNLQAAVRGFIVRQRLKASLKCARQMSESVDNNLTDCPEADGTLPVTAMSASRAVSSDWGSRGGRGE